ncbi:MAG: ATP synthase F1 subunit epsilon [Candidatus Kapabacteria bacterium]|nr:ATP synthase F1 subunit epsilon [Candidatus Kapabacteria bacterium]MDW7996779.1 ATP synthase F1 subunit epsilon [Bacteroidota bacterium]
MQKALQLDIVTPQGTVFSGPVAAVTVPGGLAPFQVLYNHAPILSTLESGVLKILLPDLTPRYYAIGSGFVEVLNNRITVLVERVVAGEAIEPMAASERLRQAQLRVESAQTREELRKARQELHEAEVALRAARLARQHIGTT